MVAAPHPGTGFLQTGVIDALDPIPEPVVTAALALAVILAGWWISRIVVRLLGRSVARRFERPSVTRTVLRLIRLTIILAAVGVAFWILDLTGIELLLSVTVISAIIAIILAPLVGNYVSGMFVLADRPYEIGDLIEIVDTGVRGYVEDVTIRYTKVFTVNNTFLVIPNATMRERDVVNFSAEDERTRLSIDLVVTYGGDLDAARGHFVEAARSVDGVIDGGPPIRIGTQRYSAEPVCHIAAFGDDGIELELHFWIRHPKLFRQVKSAVHSAIWAGMAGLDVEFAYPHRQLVVEDGFGMAPVSKEGPAGAIDP